LDISLNHNCDEANTGKNLSKLAGVSHNTIARVQKIEAKATPGY